MNLALFLPIVVLIIIGLIIAVLTKLFLVLIPAIIFAANMYFITSDLFQTGIAFAVVTLLLTIAKI